MGVIHGVKSAQKGLDALPEPGFRGEFESGLSRETALRMGTFISESRKPP